MRLLTTSPTPLPHPVRPPFFRRLCTMLIVMALFTACVLTVKGAFTQAALLIAIVPLWVTRFRHFAYHR